MDRTGRLIPMHDVLKLSGCKENKTKINRFLCNTDPKMKKQGNIFSLEPQKNKNKRGILFSMSNKEVDLDLFYRVSHFLSNEICVNSIISIDIHGKVMHVAMAIEIALSLFSFPNMHNTCANLHGYGYRVVLCFFCPSNIHYKWDHDANMKFTNF